jgi:hypothetical protein
VPAHNVPLPQVRQRVATDPFAAHRVVDAEIAPGMADPRLNFLVPAR